MGKEESNQKKKRLLMIEEEIKEFELAHGKVAMKQNGRWISQEELRNKNRENFQKTKANFKRIKNDK